MLFLFYSDLSLVMGILVRSKAISPFSISYLQSNQAAPDAFHTRDTCCDSDFFVFSSVCKASYSSPANPNWFKCLVRPW